MPEFVIPKVLFFDCSCFLDVWKNLECAGCMGIDNKFLKGKVGSLSQKPVIFKRDYVLGFRHENQKVLMCPCLQPARTTSVGQAYLFRLSAIAAAQAGNRNFNAYSRFKRLPPKYDL